MVNYFNIKTAMGDTSSIEKPSDLYSLDFDIEEGITKKDLQIVNTPLTDFEKKMLGL